MQKISFVVIKRDGRQEPFNINKLSKIINIAAADYEDKLDINKFFSKLQLQLTPVMKSSEIMNNLINTAINLVVESPADEKIYWSYFVNRLILTDFKKKVRLQRQQEYNLDSSQVNKYGFFTDADLFREHIKKYTYEYPVYHKWLIEKIPSDIFSELYDRIFLSSKKLSNPLWSNVKHYQTQKLIKSYCTKYNGKVIETPEELWFLQSLMAFLPSVLYYGKDWNYYKRKVLEHYKYLSRFLIIPATPQLLNLRKQRANLSSCFILDVHDTSESILHTQTQIGQISRNAGGIGLYLGKLRPSGSSLRGYKGVTNNIAEWIRIYNDTVYAFNQQGLRKGAITVALPIYHKDLIDFLEVIDTDIGDVNKKSPDVFTQVVVYDYFLQALKSKDEFYLIDRHELIDELGRKDLDLEGVYGDKATRRYEQIVQLCKAGELTNYIKLSAREILRKIFYYWSRKGLPYIAFADNINKYSPFKEHIPCVNLCVENFSPVNNTNPKDNYCISNEELGMIHTCNITNVNLYGLLQKGILFDDNKLAKFVQHLYEYMDNLIDITDLPVKESKKHNSYYRTVTAGFVGLADVFVALNLQQNKPLYSYRYYSRKIDPQHTLGLIDKIFGRFAFLAVLASTNLARERGKVPAFEKTKYADGIILGRFDLNAEDTKQLITDLLGEKVYDAIKHNLQNYGIRNSMLLNCPPNTSTSLVAGVTASVLPPYSLVQVEDKQKGVFVNFVPLISELGSQWYYDVYSQHFTTVDDYKSLIEVIGHIQRYIDAGISFEITVNHNYFRTAEQLTYLYSFIFREAYKNSIKALYYWRHILPDKTDADKKEMCESCAN